ncbi:uncharacterized protein LOC120350023 [Nilaparvata lugens]|uniref:uncharacterized protein LOC120350023 n=1 Tax=Nilaparvata lugens TaxID=108931 RepID=UPI00193D5D96|nr:uncharacterized protein LOC120350023 [Nilaparvata lugens]
MDSMQMEDEKSIPLSNFGNKVPKALSTLYLLFTFCMQIDLIVSMKIQWKDFMLRILSIKEFNTTLFAMFGYLSMNFEVAHLDRMIDMHFRRMKNMQGNKIIETRDLRKRGFERIASRIFMTIFLSASILPYFQGVLLAVKNGTKDLNFEKLPYIIYTHYPDTMRTVPIYLTILTTQFLWYGLMLIQWYRLYKSYFVSALCLITEMELLVVALNDLDEKDKNTNGNVNFNKIEKTSNNSLDKYMAALVKEHHIICRGLKTLNTGASCMNLGFYNVFALQMCLYILFVIEMDEMVARIKYTVTGIIVFSISISGSKIGQDVADQGERLRLAMYQSEWIDKPVWLQKFILLMITRASRNMEMKPYGLYVLNMSSVTNVVKGTYTYFNLVTNLRV